MPGILIVGCGDLGAGVGAVLAEEGHQVFGLKRHPPSDAGLIEYIKSDLTKSSDLESLDTDFEQVLIILTPDSRDARAYHDVFIDGVNNLLQIFTKNKSTASFTFVSSTSVYGQTDGAWVDEASETNPASERGEILLAAEQAVRAQNPHNTVIRFSGIYGPGRDRLLRTVAAGGAVQKVPPAYTNRIHREDCIGVMQFILGKKLAGEILASIYVVSDDEPVPMWDVVTWLANKTEAPAPVAKPENTDASRNKRIRNQRIKALGYAFKYPGYRDGYRAMFGSTFSP